MEINGLGVYSQLSEPPGPTQEILPMTKVSVPNKFSQRDFFFFLNGHASVTAMHLHFFLCERE